MIIMNKPFQKVEKRNKKKAKVISRLVSLGYNTLVFFDDSETNLNFAKDLENKYDIKIITVKV